MQHTRKPPLIGHFMFLDSKQQRVSRMIYRLARQEREGLYPVSRIGCTRAEMRLADSVKSQHRGEESYPVISALTVMIVITRLCLPLFQQHPPPSFYHRLSKVLRASLTSTHSHSIELLAAIDTDIASWSCCILPPVCLKAGRPRIAEREREGRAYGPTTARGEECPGRAAHRSTAGGEGLSKKGALSCGTCRC
ncbi:hypothetical protein CDAR_68181 [Caerostris darwini]|uniref:Uncharacterized protein n=1 Tax=Caerostris darwini TaxID=1538125 RepID=A0AAV4VTI6_9ARAC|nr:hypothetical protein CDAR_68181 [Caerostris darwini]